MQYFNQKTFTYIFIDKSLGNRHTENPQYTLLHKKSIQKDE